MGSKKRKHNFIVTHEFADGRVMSDEEFLSKPFEVEYDKNKEIYEAAQRMFDTNYLLKERERRKRETIEARRVRLEEEAERIASELNSI